MKTNLRNFKKNINDIFYPELNCSRLSNKMTFMNFMLNNNLISETSIKELDSFFLSKDGGGKSSIKKLNFVLNNMALINENQLSMSYESVIQTLMLIAPHIPWDKIITPDNYNNNIGGVLIFYAYLCNLNNIQSNRNNLFLIISHLSKLENKIPYQIIKSLYISNRHMTYLLPIHLIPALYYIVNTYQNSPDIKKLIFGSFLQDECSQYGNDFNDTSDLTINLFHKLKHHYLSVIKNELS